MAYSSSIRRHSFNGSRPFAVACLIRFSPFPELSCLCGRRWEEATRRCHLGKQLIILKCLEKIERAVALVKYVLMEACSLLK